MDLFDYFVREYNLKDDKKEIPRYEAELRQAGQEGWELVNVVPLQTSVVANGTTTKMLATFKRKRPAAYQQQKVS
jgi:hypothetical protein